VATGGNLQSPVEGKTQAGRPCGSAQGRPPRRPPGDAGAPRGPGPPRWAPGQYSSAPSDRLPAPIRRAPGFRSRAKLCLSYSLPSSASVVKASADWLAPRIQTSRTGRGMLLRRSATGLLRRCSAMPICSSSLLCGRPNAWNDVARARAMAPMPRLGPARRRAPRVSLDRMPARDPQPTDLQEPVEIGAAFHNRDQQGPPRMCVVPGVERCRRTAECAIPAAVRGPAPAQMPRNGYRVLAPLPPYRGPRPSYCCVGGGGGG